jgi:ABC-type amino acid transport substrate-binding protein
VPKDSSYTFTKEGFEGKGLKLALQRGAASIPYVDKHFGGVFEQVLYDNPDQMRLDLMAGRIDLVFDSKINWTLELIMKPEGRDWKLDGGDHGSATRRSRKRSAATVGPCARVTRR